ncbi:hypothetical protein HII31_11945 [Pseudocercospora fuligena]|uniref:Uncharacterized protein n=1 Tax=Pseudocercospora fuligena TaxID=685502 RepID=A0A8H6R904_9PEZI|nr:hypothetical protein HII31_11945 [Pseudocercospora fuligena]
MANSAKDQVFRTTELLEAILLQDISFQQLFVIQRTCRAFQETINGSILLKRAMCLEPLPGYAENVCDYRETINHLLPQVVFAPKDSTAGDGVVFCAAWQRNSSDIKSHLDFHIVSEETIPQQYLFQRQRLDDVSQSWHRMLVFRQPDTQKTLRRTTRTKPRPVNSRTQRELLWVTTFNPDITMGELYTGVMVDYQTFLKARAKGKKRASDWILEHGGKMDNIMELASDSEDE